MYLSYSGWSKYEGCGYAYWNGYINKTKVEVLDDRLGSIFGSVVGSLFEDFYNKQMWRQEQPLGRLTEEVEARVRKIIRDETTTTSSWRRAGVILWKGDGEGQNPKGIYADEAEIAADVRDTLERGFRIIRHERLLGRDARAEVKLDTDIEGHRIGGRADFRMTRTAPHKDRIIVDGKGSKWREKYVHPDQLFWYALLNRERDGYLPDRVGFLFWKFDPPKSMDWYEVTDKVVDDLKERILRSISQIEELSKRLGASKSFEDARKVFLPVAARPDATKAEIEQACRFCTYATEEICPEGALVAQKLASKK